MKFYLTLLRREGKRLPEQPVPENARTIWLEFAQLVDTVSRQDARWPTSFDQVSWPIAAPDTAGLHSRQQAVDLAARMRTMWA